MLGGSSIWTSGCLVLSLVGAVTAQQNLAYIPFAWNRDDNRPVSATIRGSDSSGRTTWGLYDRPGDRTPGPATLIVGTAGSTATMRYVAEPTLTLTGDCILTTPVAACAINLDDLPDRFLASVEGEAGGPVETASSGGGGGGSGLFGGGGGGGIFGGGGGGAAAGAVRSALWDKGFDLGMGLWSALLVAGLPLGMRWVLGGV
ncbi:hypothetical protein CC2G_011283 [Coprinopsis cinerea AmutBmut pab1-1]|nr:hypothetical protein CC2G_011283 [Coprinopsis cinerea AmutBmut pab1-1]